MFQLQVEDAELNVADLEEWEKKYGRIPDHACVFANSGWGVKYWDNQTAFIGTDSGDITKLHNPGFGKDAAE